VAALRFEIEFNLEWLDDIFESRNYLRDEAWVGMKNKGYISYLRSPIPLKVITTYNQLHRLNEQIRVLKERPRRVRKSSMLRRPKPIENTFVTALQV
jgi:hypothetical protein